MNLSKMTKEELETLSYADLTEMILKEEKNSLNTPSIFKKICELLELRDDEYASQIGDFYTLNSLLVKHDSGTGSLFVHLPKFLAGSSFTSTSCHFPKILI